MKNYSNFEQLLTRRNLHEEIDAELALRSLREFVRQAWLVIEPSTPFVPGWHIDAIIEHLEAVTRGEIRNLLINVPPRHMKSLLVSVFWPAWEWIRWPERRWLFSSYAASLSIRDSLKCRRLIESPWYQRLWGNGFALTTDQKQRPASITIAQVIGLPRQWEGQSPVRAATASCAMIPTTSRRPNRTRFAKARRIGMTW